MTTTCPTCGTVFDGPVRFVTYEWDDVTGVYCPKCNTPERRKTDAPTLEPDDFETKRVVQRRWEDENMRVYLEVGDTPGCITFATGKLVEVGDGNTRPLEFRLEKEFNRVVDLEGAGGEIADLWLSQVEEFHTVNGTRTRGGRE